MTHVFMYVCMYVCMCADVSKEHVHTRMPTSRSHTCHAYVGTYATCVDAQMHACIHTCIDEYIHTPVTPRCGLTAAAKWSFT
jgi:hypothetical protein